LWPKIPKTRDSPTFCNVARNVFEILHLLIENQAEKGIRFQDAKIKCRLEAFPAEVNGLKRVSSSKKNGISKLKLTP